MLFWREEQKQSRPLHPHADRSQLTLFAVTKYDTVDILTSWPGVLNSFSPDPPEPDFPDPSLFSQVRCIGEKIATFFLDIANMCHNQKLSRDMSDLFSLRAITGREIHPGLQEVLRTQLYFPKYKNPKVCPSKSAPLWALNGPSISAISPPKHLYADPC